MYISNATRVMSPTAFLRTIGTQELLFSCEMLTRSLLTAVPSQAISPKQSVAQLSLTTLALSLFVTATLKATSLNITVGL